MAEFLYFTRDTKVYVEFDDVVWEVPVLDGFSFSQATNSSEITLSEMESSTGASRRGRRAFNDSLAPAEWSFSTYVRPYRSTGGTLGTTEGIADATANAHHAVEEVLWALFMGADDWNAGAFRRGTSAISTSDTTDFDLDFSQSNFGTLGTANIYFVLGESQRKVMKLEAATVNEASIDFDVDGLATINWSGSANTITDFTANTAEVAAASKPTTGTGSADGDVLLLTDKSYQLIVTTAASGASHTDWIDEDVLQTDNFIRNKLTSVTVTPTSQDPDSDSVNELESSYSLTLTGGNITFTNNITYITPEELGTVNEPFGHVTGARTINGTMNCYLTDDDTDTNSSIDFFEDLKSITNVVTNSFALVFSIGGASGTPRLEVNMPTCHVEIPTHSIDDVISLETGFMALPSTIGGTDDATLKYVGAT